MAIGANPICSVCGHAFGFPKISFCPFEKCWVDELDLDDEEGDEEEDE